MVSIGYVATHAEAWVAYPSAEVEMGGIADVAFSPDSGHVLTRGQLEGPVRIRDAASGVLLQELNDRARVAKYSRDGRWIGVVERFGGLAVYDASNYRPIPMLEEVSGAATDIDFSSDGTLLAAGWEDGRVTIWDVDKRQRVRVLKGRSSEVRWVGFSSNRQRLAAMYLLGEVFVWDLRDGNVVAEFSEFSEFSEFTEKDAPVRSADLSPDGRWVVTAHYNGASRLLDVDQGVVAGRWDEFDPSMDLPGTAIFSPDSRLLALGRRPTIVRMADGKVLVRGFNRYGIGRLGFSSDGARLLAGNSVFDTATGRVLFTFKGNDDDDPFGAVFASGGDVAFVVAGPGDVASVWHRRRPEQWWGILWLPAFWMAVAAAGVFAVALSLDVRYVRRMTRGQGEPQACERT
jgi:hypothetical protein